MNNRKRLSQAERSGTILQASDDFLELKKQEKTHHILSTIFYRREFFFHCRCIPEKSEFLIRNSSFCISDPSAIRSEE